MNFLQYDRSGSRSETASRYRQAEGGRGPRLRGMDESGNPRKPDHIVHGFLIKDELPDKGRIAGKRRMSSPAAIKDQSSQHLARHPGMVRFKQQFRARQTWFRRRAVATKTSVCERQAASSPSPSWLFMLNKDFEHNKSCATTPPVRPAAMSAAS
jgi:hypothetical protein